MTRASSASTSVSSGHRRVVVATALALLALLVFAGSLSSADAAISKKRAAKKKAAADAKAAAAAASASASASDDATVAEERPPPGEVLVTCGSAIKLEHADTGRLLHSQNIAYGGEGSGQMSVTAAPTATDPGSVWLVKPAFVAATADADGKNAASSSSSSSSSSSPPSPLPLRPSCSRGQPLRSGDRVRLQHAQSRRWLHSHHFPSPLSRQLEVSAFGGERESDALDVWVVEVAADSDAGASAGGAWKRDGLVSLKHVETGAHLSSSGLRAYGHPLAGHSEVFGSTARGGGGGRKENLWKAGEGVFFEVSKTAAAVAK